MALALVGVGAVALATTGGALDACSVATFDTRAWSDESSNDREPDGGASARQRLADQLIECGALRVARRSQVRDLLGPPDNYVARDSRLYEEGTWSYSLGTERGFIEIDDEHLVVRFGPEGRVRSMARATD